MRFNFLITFLICATSCGWRYEIINSRNSTPNRKIRNAQCLDNTKTSIRLLGNKPNVPFAIIDKNEIKSAGHSCCLEWATTQKEWFNLDKHGKIVETSIIQNTYYYDVNQCYEQNLKVIKGDSGVGLYVSQYVDWEFDENRSVWLPTGIQKANLDTFLMNLDELVIDKQKSNFSHFASPEMIFFEIQTDPTNIESYLSNTKCVVYGYRYLVIAYINNGGFWTLAHFENEFVNSDYKIYKPIALIDIDKDGIPEIIFHDSLGHAFWDKLLKIRWKETIDSWQIEAISVEGATL